MISLTSLPAPVVVEVPDFESIFNTLWSKWIELNPTYPYKLESDPAVKLLEAWAYDRMLLMELMNEVGKRTLLLKASGTVLDHIGASNGVERLIIVTAFPLADPPTLAVYESDDPFRERILLRVSSPATAGSIEHYEFWARSASHLVKNAKAFSPNHGNGFNMGGQVIINILSTVGNHVPSDELLLTVRNLVTSEQVKVATDLVTVEAAVRKIVDVSVQIKLKKGTPLEVFNALRDKFVQDFAARIDLGVDVTRSFINSSFYVEGVHAVTITSPNQDIVVGPNEFPVLGTLTVTFAGYSDDDGFNVDAVEIARTMRVIYQTYLNSCIASRKPASVIETDLYRNTRAGILEPTTVGFAEYLAIQGIRKADGTLRSESEVCILIHSKISTQYA